jgi:hypothetical protein
MFRNVVAMFCNTLITEGFYPTVLEYMLKINAKLEQEVIVIETF